MKELVVISGKGGTGKTSLVSAFAAKAENMVLCDADVDAADLFLVMDPAIVSENDFWSGCTAVINPDKCTQCDVCRDLCRFNAIDETYTVDSISCEGCGVCVYFCPEKAVDFPENNCGNWFISDTRFGPMVHARLGVAEENSGKLVSLVRQEAAKLAKSKGLDLILTDGPPGVGCPVIASIGNASAVVIVTEPSMSGKHDMERVGKLAAHFQVPAMVCINKYDLNLDISREIEAYAEKNGLIFLGNIPFDPTFTKAMVQGRTLFEYQPDSPAGPAVNDLWKKITEILQSTN